MIITFLSLQIFQLQEFLSYVSYEYVQFLVFQLFSLDESFLLSVSDKVKIFSLKKEVH